MGPWYTSGLRVGTPAVTTLGMGEAEMREIAAIIRHVLSHTAPGTIESGPRQGERSRARYIVDHGAIGTARGRVADLLRRHPLYPEIDLDLLLAAPFARAGKL
jgi:glycine hydroxymethyltransferase